MIIARDGLQTFHGREMLTSDFEVTWAGNCSWQTGLYSLGSEDGRVLYRTVDDSVLFGPWDVSPSGNAVNGIAYAANLMAVSTCAEITFFKVPDGGKGRIERAFSHGGAHGVIATRDEHLVAPMGRRGILVMGTSSAESQTVRTITAKDEDTYIYKLVCLSDPSRGTIVACAGRRGGLVSLPLFGVSVENRGRGLRPGGVDLVDVAAQNAEGFPFAVAGLGLDGSIHFVRDMLADTASKAMRFSMPQERAYRLLCTEGHVFMLTDKSLYAFVDLARRFIEGDDLAGPTLTRRVDLEAIDIAVGADRSLLLVMSESVYWFKIDALIARGDDGVEQFQLASPESVLSDSISSPAREWTWSMEQQLAG